ncbi:hypothetical protein [Microcystis aeruginosa]|uniref:hypothetical protein n=1 Tax=Microcystis aeruginosa TaxID=1126 RepID=UPI001D149549|nr:hypothetical protein [Microcystis aeruginosa]
MKTLSRLNSKESALTILVIVSQIFVVNVRVIAQSIPQISIPRLPSPVIPIRIPNIVIPTVNVTIKDNIPSTSLKSPPVIPTAITPTVNVTIKDNIPSTSLKSPPIIPTLNVSFNEQGRPIFAKYDGKDISTNIPSILDLKPLTFSVTGNQGNTEPSSLSVINNNGVTTETTRVGSTSIPIPQPTAANGQLVTVSTVNVVFPSSQKATGISSTVTGNSSSFNLQVNFTAPVLD